MKTLNDFIIERLKIDKDTKINDDIPTKFSDDITFTQEEINILQKYMKQLKIKPVILTNYTLQTKRIGINKMKQILQSSKYNIYVYFNDDWETKRQDTYLYINKDNEEPYTWFVTIIIKYVYYNFKQNKSLSENIEDVCAELINQLQNDNKFYNALKNN